MKKHPAQFESYFTTGTINVENTINILQFHENVEEPIKEYLLDFLRTSNDGDIKEFLIFVTGAPIIPTSIVIQSEKSSHLHAITCTNTLILPKCFPDKETFRSALKALISLKSFNTI
jgi:HECT-domain (ubiquitin-transferase).